MRRTPFAGAGPQILLVEDDEMLLEVMGAAIERQGYTFETALTGEQALEKAYTLKPALVLLDISLPEQSGYLVAAKLKLLAPRPKVVFITAMPRGQSDRMAAFLHVDGIMHKPFAMGKLISSLDRMLGLTHAA